MTLAIERLQWPGVPEFTNSPDQWGLDGSTTTGLTYGYKGGTAYTTSGVISRAADGTVLLTDNATNYVERTTAGTVSANTSGFTAGRIAMAKVTTLSSVITAYEDWRVRHMSEPILTAPGTGAVPRFLSDKLADAGLSLKDFGATGNGTTDDSTARDNCIAEARALGVPVLVPPGTFKFTTPWYLKDNDVIKGASRRRSILNFVGCDGFARDAGVSTAHYVEMKSLKIVAGDIFATSTYKALNLNGMRYGNFQRLRFEYAKYAIFLQPGTGGCFFHTFEDIEGFGNETHVHFDYSVPANGTVNNCSFRGLRFEDVGTWGVPGTVTGIRLEGIGNWFFDTYINCFNRAIKFMDQAANNIFFGGYLESSPTYVIDCPNGSFNGFNYMLGVHYDGSGNINDPNKCITILDQNGFKLNQGVSGKPTMIFAKPFQFDQTTAPSNPAAGLTSEYMDQADGKVKLKKSDGTTTSLN